MENSILNKRKQKICYKIFCFLIFVYRFRQTLQEKVDTILKGRFIMIKNKLKTVLILILTLSIIAMGINTYAHSGRTDSNGGHKDKKNASGLGYYHYHCGGHPPHLHDNGICPYSSNASTATTTKSTKPKTSTSSSSKSTKSRTTSSSKNTKSNTSSSTSSKTTKSNTLSTTSKKSTTTNPTNTSTKKVVKEETTVAVKDIEINEDIESMEIGESESLTVTITPSNATDKKVTWKSSDKDIVKVSSSGKITAKEAGTATITATSSNGKTNTIKIKVKEEPKQQEKEIAEPITKNDENSNKTIPTSSSAVTNNSTESKEEESSGGGGIIAILLGYLGYRKFRGR